jgi:hypothetical protein
MKNRLVVLSLVVLGAMVFVSSAKAQRRVAFASARSRTGFSHLRRPQRFDLGSAFGSYFYSDYDSEPGLTQEAPPQSFLLQAAPLPPSSASSSSPHESLVLELEGNRWVRIRTFGESQTSGTSSQAQSERESDLSTAAPRPVDVEPPREVPAAVLVFRDGRQEEIGKYMVMGATIYTSADYWSTGSWTRKIAIAELDVPATLKINQQRGARFSLPSGPNEVMIRP